MKRTMMALATALLLTAGMLGGAGTAGAAEPVKLGFVYIMSGPFATYGQFAKQGAELAVNEINSKGGILGRPVEAFFEDSTGKPDVAVRAIRKLVFQEKVDCLVGLDSSGVAKTVAPLIPQMKTPLIVTHAATPDVTGDVCNPYTFRVSLNLSQNIKAAALLAADTDAKTWSTVGPDYAFGHQSWEYFRKYLKELDPEARFASEDGTAFASTKTTDFSPYITKIMGAKPDGVLVSLWGGNLIDFVRQADEMGFFKGDFEVLMTLGAATEVLYSLKDKMPENVWVGSRYWFLMNDSPVNQAFVEAYRKAYDQYPSYNAHGAYAAVQAYKAAAEKVQGTDKEKIVRGLEGLSLELPAGTVVIRAEDHQAVTDAPWGRTAADENYPIRVLEPLKIFKGSEVTPAAEDTGCNMKR